MRNAITIRIESVLNRSSATSRLPLRVAIELLTNRVDQLCHFITENGLQPPQLPPEKDKALKKILESLGLRNETSTIPSLPNECRAEKSSEIARDPVTCLPDVSQNPAVAPKTGSADSGTDSFAEGAIEADIHALSSTPQNMLFNFPFSEDSQNIDQDSPNSILSSWDLDIGFMTCINPTSIGTQYLFRQTQESGTGFEQEELVSFLDPIVCDDDETLVEETESTEDIESLIDEISDRVGTLRIGPGGKTHFCGPTSTFNLTGVLESEEPEARPINELYPLGHHDCSGRDPEIPPALEEHLINLYFCWQDPFCHVVDRNMYAEAKRKWQGMEDTPFYSEALRYAM